MQSMQVITDDETDFATATDRLASRDSICSLGYILGQDTEFVQKFSKLAKEVFGGSGCIELRSE